MMTIQKTYPNGFQRTFTVTHVTDMGDGRSVILDTAEDGAVIVCADDQPDLWSQILAAGHVPAAAEGGGA